MKLPTTMIVLCALAMLAGCGFDATVREIAGDASSEADVVAPPNAPAPVPAEPPLSGPTAFDPAGAAAFGFEDADILTSLFADQLVLELLAPSGPALEFTFLERLCLEGDDPDFFCHQRFGR